MNNCCVCDTAVSVNFFVCANACKSVIHGSCAGIASDDVFNAILKITNLSWTCNMCSDRFHVLDAKIASLNADVDKINKLLQISSSYTCSTTPLMPIQLTTLSSLSSVSSNSTTGSSCKNRNIQKTLNCKNSKLAKIDTIGPSTRTRSKCAPPASIISVDNKSDNTSTHFSSVHISDDQVEKSITGDDTSRRITTQSRNLVNNLDIKSDNTSTHFSSTHISDDQVEKYITEDGTSSISTQSRNFVNNRNVAVIIGSSNDIDHVICAAESRRWLFISRLRHTVTEAELVQYMNTKFNLIGVQCVKLNHRFDAEYASFKLNVPADKFDNLLDANLWSAGLLVKEYVKPKYAHKRSQRNLRNRVSSDDGCTSKNV